MDENSVSNLLVLRKFFRYLQEPKILGSILIAVTLLHAFPYIFQPLGLDQALYSVMARYLDSGMSLYRDFGDMNFPGAPLLHTLALVLFGDSTIGFRLFDLLFVCFTLWSIYLFMYRCFSHKSIALVSCIIFIICYFHLGFWHTAQRDGFAIPFLLLATSLFFDSERSNPLLRTILAGLCCGIIFWIKPVFGISLAVFGLVLILRLLRKKQRFSLLFTMGTGLTIGFSIINAIFLFYLYQTNSLVAWYEGAILYNLQYSSSVSKPMMMAIKAIFVPANFHNFFITIGAMVGIWHTFDNSDNWRKSIPLAVFTLITIFSFLIQGKGDVVYHRLPFLCAKSLWAALGIRIIFSWSSLRGARSLLFRGIILSGLILITAGSYVVTFHIPAYFRFLTGSSNLTTYQSEIYMGLDEKISVGNYIRENTSDEDRILVWGFGSLIQFYSQRLSSSRFITNTNLFVLPKDDPLRRSWEQAIAKDFERYQPKAVVLFTKEEPQWFWKFPNWPENAKKDFMSIPEFSEALMRQYHLVMETENVEVYFRNNSENH